MTYHQRTGGNVGDVPGTVETATVDGVLWARTDADGPIGGDGWDYRFAGADADLLAAFVGADDSIVAVLAAFGVTP